MSRKERCAKHPISIRWKLVFFIGIMTATVLLITWIFQVYLLENFYEMTKRRELKATATQIAAHVDSDKLHDMAIDYAIDGSMRILVMKQDESGVSTLADADATVGMAMYPNRAHFSELLERVQSYGGIYIHKITFGGREIEGEGSFEIFGDDHEEADGTEVNPESTRLICISMTKNRAGETCLIVLNTALLPMDSTVQTLHVQFVWIAFVLFWLSVIAVLAIYRTVSKPLIQMNDAAKQLAQGKYDTAFVGTGYLETHELADTLNYAAKELSQVDRLQKELLANISHDLRTPLTMIKGYGELMRDIPGEMSPENMQIVIDETERLSELVTDLLDLSNLQSGNNDHPYVTFDLTETIRRVIKRYDTFVHHRGYTLRFEAERDAWVCANQKQIVQVIYNLINNAINYTGEDLTVVVKQEILDDTVRISVLDTGEGIAPDQLPLIWDRYYKVDKVHRRAMVGTGLGLSIVKGILEHHGAEYGVSSTLGSGSLFWFEMKIESGSDGNIE